MIGIGVCLQKYPSLQLQFANGLAEILHILANYAVLILAIVGISSKVLRSEVNVSLTNLDAVLTTAFRVVRKNSTDLHAKENRMGKRF